MADTGWVSPQTAASVDRDANRSWIDPNNAKTEDANDSYSDVDKEDYSDWLRLTDYYNGGSGYDIPSGATVDGIQLKIVRHAEKADEINDSSLRLRTTAGQVGDDNASASYWDISEETVYYGGAEDAWGRSWSVSELNSADFGIDLSAFNNDDSAYRMAYIDVIEVKIYYTEGGVTPSYSGRGVGRGIGRGVMR